MGKECGVGAVVQEVSLVTIQGAYTCVGRVFDRGACIPCLLSRVVSQQSLTELDEASLFQLYMPRNGLPRLLLLNQGAKWSDLLNC